MENNNQPVVEGQPPNSAVNQPVTPPPSVPTAMPTYPPSPQNYVVYQGAFQETNTRKFPWIGVALGVLLIAGATLSFWFYKLESNHTNAKQHSTVVSTPKVPAPLVTTSTPATIGVGMFTVGPDKNIIPSLYSLAPGVQQSGTFTIISPTATYTVTLNDNATLGNGTKVAWVQLSSGDKVQISGGNLTAVTFKSAVLPPSTPPALAKLYTGSFTVTDDPTRANPGKYLISDSLDKNVDILILSKDYTIKYNQPLNSTGFLVDLVDGDQVATVNVSHFDMEPR